jgi:hypothetical protein
MPTATCLVRGPESDQAVRAAISYCQENRAVLSLVGVVEDKATDSTRVWGARLRRAATVRFELARAAEAARVAGVLATTRLRAGNLMTELAQEANAPDARELFFVVTRGRIRATLTGKPRQELVRMTLTGSNTDRFDVAA